MTAFPAGVNPMKQPVMLTRAGVVISLLFACSVALAQTQQDRFVTVNGLRIHYLDWGSETKPPLILLHGIGRLWLAGAAIAWENLPGGARRRVALPTYPFEGEHHWLAQVAPPVPAARASVSPTTGVLHIAG